MGYAVTPRDITFSRRKGCARDEKYARDGEGREGNQKLFFDNGDQPSGLGGYVAASNRGVRMRARSTRSKDAIHTVPPETSNVPRRRRNWSIITKLNSTAGIITRGRRRTD